MISKLLSTFGRFYPIRRGRWTLSRHAVSWCRGPAIARLRCGSNMLVDRSNAVDRVIYLFGEYDREEMEWLISKAGQSSETLLYDIGANIGAYSVIMPSLLPGLQVRAFEPDLRNLVFLRANICINALEDRVTIMDVAVGDEAGTVQFLESRGGDLLNTGKSKVVTDSASGTSLRTVRKIAIDDLAIPIGTTVLMKIDVEGYEFDVLKGMSRTLREHRCYLMIEIFPDNLAKCDELMTELGYHRTVSFGSDDWAYEPSEP